MPRVCAIVVTHNRKELLRTCLDSLLAQSRPVDSLVVVDNASSDGTAQMLDQDYPRVLRINLKEYTGGAGGLSSGMRWAHCNKFDWTWVMHDGIELKPDCLETMLSFADDGDLIQVRKQGAGTDAGWAAKSGEGTWVPTEICDFQGALIGKKAIESAGLPDERYFDARDDISYGYIAARKSRSILLNYTGAVQSADDQPPTTRASFYLSVRNRFLNRENMTKNGVPPPAPAFFFQTLLVLLNKLGEAASAGTNNTSYALAAIDGLRDGLHKRFDRLPRS